MIDVHCHILPGVDFWRAVETNSEYTVRHSMILHPSFTNTYVKECRYEESKKSYYNGGRIGTRMEDLTEHITKPLLMVKGRILIESIIEALIINEIREIYIVVGYRKEKFEYLAEKYEEVRLIENPYYEISNNISSLHMAREYIEDSIILDGDQLINNPSVLFNGINGSGYCS